MPRKVPWPPPVYQYRGNDVMRVRLGPRRYRDFTLGPTGSEEAKRAYARKLLELEAVGGRGPGGGTDLTVAELALAYLEHSKARRSSGDHAGDKHAWATVARVYGETPAREFGPLALKACRAAWLKEGREGCELVADYEARKKKGKLRRGERRPKVLARVYVNRLTRNVRAGFSWAVGEEMVPEEVAAALDRVVPLEKRDRIAPEREKVRPADPAHVEATLPHLPPIVADMVRLQLLTGLRPGEACALRPADLDREWKTVSGVAVWLYRLDGKHKADWRGHERWVPIGPKAQALLRPYLERDPAAYCFSPKEVAAAWKIAHGRSPRCGRKRKPGDRYTTQVYDRCVARACKRAGVDWSPNQSRHTVGTQVERDHGREDARVVLGHSTPSTTAIYAEGVERAALVIAKIG